MGLPFARATAPLSLVADGVARSFRPVSRAFFSQRRGKSDRPADAEFPSRDRGTPPAARVFLPACAAVPAAMRLLGLINPPLVTASAPASARCRTQHSGDHRRFALPRWPLLSSAIEARSLATRDVLHLQSGSLDTALGRDWVTADPRACPLSSRRPRFFVSAPALLAQPDGLAALPTTCSCGCRSTCARRATPSHERARARYRRREPRGAAAPAGAPTTRAAAPPTASSRAAARALERAARSASMAPFFRTCRTVSHARAARCCVLRRHVGAPRVAVLHQQRGRSGCASSCAHVDRPILERARGLARRRSRLHGERRRRDPRPPAVVAARTTAAVPRTTSRCARARASCARFRPTSPRSRARFSTSSAVFVLSRARLFHTHTHDHARGSSSRRRRRRPTGPSSAPSALATAKGRASGAPLLVVLGTSRPSRSRERQQQPKLGLPRVRQLARDRRSAAAAPAYPASRRPRSNSAGAGHSSRPSARDRVARPRARPRSAASRSSSSAHVERAGRGLVSARGERTSPSSVSRRVDRCTNTRRAWARRARARIAAQRYRRGAVRARRRPRHVDRRRRRAAVAQAPGLDAFRGRASAHRPREQSRVPRRLSGHSAVHAVDDKRPRAESATRRAEHAARDLRSRARALVQRVGRAAAARRAGGCWLRISRARACVLRHGLARGERARAASRSRSRHDSKPRCRRRAS